MSAENNTIMLTLDYEDGDYQVQTCSNQYHSLMSLISDNLAIPGFGLCCGMGSYGTCMVEIHEKYSYIKKVTLSCDVHINDELANARIIIHKAIY